MKVQWDAETYQKARDGRNSLDSKSPPPYAARTMTSRALCIFLVAIGVLMVSCHICPAPFHVHAAAVTTHSHDHPAGGNDDGRHSGSCEALRATPNVYPAALAGARVEVRPLTALLTATARPFPATDTSPPLFLLHAVLLI